MRAANARRFPSTAAPNRGSGKRTLGEAFSYARAIIEHDPEAWGQPIIEQWRTSCWNGGTLRSGSSGTQHWLKAAMPAKKTNVVRRSLFGSGGISKAAADVGEPSDQATRSRASRHVSRAAEPSAVDEGATTRASRRPVERTAITVPTDLLPKSKGRGGCSERLAAPVHDGAFCRGGVRGSARAFKGRAQWRPRIRCDQPQDQIRAGARIVNCSCAALSTQNAVTFPHGFCIVLPQPERAVH